MHQKECNKTMKRRTPRKTTNAKKDGFCFKLGVSGCVSLLVLVVIGMAWAFILGVIVGRGYQPEKIAKEVAQKFLPEDFPLLTEKNEEVLKAEELEFFEKLKQGSTTASTSLAAAPPVPAKASAPSAPAPPQVQQKTETNTPAPAVPANDKDEVFVFNYQVAALNTMEQAQNFLKQLESGGFKTSVVTANHEGKTWYRVYVHHQGTVDSALALREKLKVNGINNVLLRSRTPL